MMNLNCSSHQFCDPFLFYLPAEGILQTSRKTAVPVTVLSHYATILAAVLLGAIQ